ncbi:actin maturation protease [Narcine bancroftii]|uniref:actin maturation protease n=1 Tax=Narcine bancroftii TaxID=1343680 RepID=UPI0038315E64
MSEQWGLSSRQDNSTISFDSDRLPLPPPPLPPPPQFSSPSALPVKKLYQVLAEGQLQPRSDREELKMLFQNRSNSFRKELNWLFINTPVPSLIQDGPQCGLVALWMAGHLLNAPEAVSLEKIVKCAVENKYTVQGEMFSGDNMVKLAKEVFTCHGELLTEGLIGSNKSRIMCHLTTGYPVLIPYDEDFNHEPCQKKGHKAHWAVVSGVLLGLRCELPDDIYERDPDIPGLYYLNGGGAAASYPEECVVTSLLLAKQGKSLKYQMWEYEQVHRSNMQLTEFSPKRDKDGTSYILPDGGVKLGLRGVVILLRPLLSVTKLVASTTYTKPSRQVLSASDYTSTT